MTTMPQWNARALVRTVGVRHRREMPDYGAAVQQADRQFWRVIRRRTLGLRWTTRSLRNRRRRVLLASRWTASLHSWRYFLDGSCIAGGLIPYARYELRLDNESGEQMAITTADDGTFVVPDPPTGRLRILVDAARCSHWIERDAYRSAAMGGSQRRAV